MVKPFDFNRIAGEYDDFYGTELGRRIDQVEKRLVEQYLSRLEGKGMLEVGCGTGHWTAFFRERGFEITAVDIAVEMLRVAEGKELEGVDFRLQDAQQLEFGDGTVENVAAITSIEFVEDRRRALDEIQRVLKPGGRVLIGCLNLNSAIGRSKEESEIYRNARFFTPESLTEVLSGFGAPQVDACAVLEGEQVLDLSGELDDDRRRAEGAFLVGLVRKER